MFRQIQIYIYKWIAIFLMGAFLITSCNDNPSSINNDEPPQLPPVESMEVDFSTFENQQAKDNNSNFAQAAVRAFVIKSLVELNLFIPKTLLTAASETEAEFNDDGEWVWSFTKNAGEDTFEVRLIATRESENEITWEFFVTNSTLGVENKLFFDGTTNADGSEGTWTYYSLLSADEEAVSNLEWTVSGEDEVSLRLDVVSDHFDNQGDYIEYAFDGTVKQVDYYDADEDETTEIEWNVETNEGYLIAPDYNNGEQACWDENLEDVNCSEI